MSEELLPCKHCGENPTFSTRDPLYGDRGIQFERKDDKLYLIYTFDFQCKCPLTHVSMKFTFNTEDYDELIKSVPGESEYNQLVNKWNEANES